MINLPQSKAESPCLMDYGVCRTLDLQGQTWQMLVLTLEDSHWQIRSKQQMLQEIMVLVRTILMISLEHDGLIACIGGRLCITFSERMCCCCCKLPFLRQDMRHGYLEKLCRRGLPKKFREIYSHPAFCAQSSFLPDQRASLTRRPGMYFWSWKKIVL